jgi:cytochrome c556
MRVSGLIVAAVAAMLLDATAVAMAQDPVAARQEEFKEFGRRAEALKVIIVDGQGQLGDASPHIAHIVQTAPEIPTWFPEGSGTGETRALPVIWERFGEFEGKAENLERLATELQEKIGAGDQGAALVAFGAMGQQGCGGCHQDFRRPQS